MSKIKSLLKYDKDNIDKGDRKIFITGRHWGFIINTKIPAAKNKNLEIYVAKIKNLFRFPSTNWVYFPKIRVLYEKIISGEVKEYYEELKRDMQSKDYKFIENNNYNIRHVRLLKKGGNKYFK
jgi:hypothetical protein|tara:strand:- start:665 stop:1033 length:369 start_codon:yes stop_codon:yes gene_type:complete